MRRPNSPARLSRSVAAVLTAVVALTAATACGKDQPPKQQASAEVQKGLAAHVAGDAAKALEHYEKAVEADPNNTYAVYNIGLLAQNRGDMAEAERRYRATIAIDPRFTAALFNLAIIRFNAGAAQEAVDLYKRVIEITPDDANAHLNLGFALQAVGRDAAGEAEFKRAIKLKPELASRLPKKKASATPSTSPQPATGPTGTPTP